MKLFAFLWCLLLMGALRAGQRPPPVEEWPAHVIRFSEKVLLRDVYDAGLRPYHFPSLERSLLEVKHKTIVLRTHSQGDLPPISCERITLNVNDPGFLTQMSFMTGQYSLQEARTKMLPWLKYGNKIEVDMDKFLAAVGADWLHYDTLPDGGKLGFGFMWKDNDSKGVRYQVTFMKAWNEATPLRLMIYMDADHLRKGREREKSYDYPIPPPPGYEKASMATPKDFGPDSPSSWQTDADRGFYPVKMPDGSPLPQKKQPIAAIQLPPTQAARSTWSIWPWITLVLLIAGVWGVLHKFRNHAKS